MMMNEYRDLLSASLRIYSLFEKSHIAKPRTLLSNYRNARIYEKNWGDPKLYNSNLRRSQCRYLAGLLNDRQAQLFF